MKAKNQYRNARSKVIAVLSERPATYVQLHDLTGASASTIEKVCILLRYAGHPCLVNLVRLKNMPQRGPVVTHAPMPAIAIVALGMASRSPLERAWAGEGL